MDLPLKRPDDARQFGPGELWACKWPRCRAAFTTAMVRQQLILGLELCGQPEMGLPFGSWCWLKVEGVRHCRWLKLAPRRELWLNLPDVLRFDRQKWPLVTASPVNSALTPAEVAHLRSAFGLTDKQISGMRAKGDCWIQTRYAARF